MSNKLLIVNADDFGQSLGINQGIIKAFEEGILTSTSLMVRYPAASDAVDYSKNNPRLDVGIHFDLGEWKYENEKWIQLYEVVDLNDIEQVKKEVNNQLETFNSLMGIMPSHMDSHQHVHLQDRFLPLFQKLAEKLNITLRRCSQKVKYCGHFYGQNEDGSKFHKAISIEGLSDILSKLTPGIHEMACHPAANLDLDTMYGEERLIELNTLCNSRIKEVLKENDIKLSSFKDISF